MTVIYRASVEINVFRIKGCSMTIVKEKYIYQIPVYEISCILAVIFSKYQGYMFWEMICQMHMVDELYKIYSYRID